ncbi:BolA family protein [Advenella mimigardefordensis]|uniref:Putative BolA-like protein n=1 Tax=Advenella mimigardefordensis (strain DSM 17166 / LMG 22922 / DPN7) TaxID=1247726 RepID=W0PGR1_ADVMD|nr:BolA family protein [Advenella mimigardefordensis]AHG64500.1 putative BolA-like protein [Advenella mimigardefordensis DPN7]
MTNQDRIALIRERLASLEPQVLDIEDESHLHKGHAGASNGAGHYRLSIRSARFNGLSRVASQRLVYDALGDLIPYPIHALSIQTQPIS